VIAQVVLSIIESQYDYLGVQPGLAQGGFAFPFDPRVKNNNNEIFITRVREY
jgi:hypothetical protein